MAAPWGLRQRTAVSLSVSAFIFAAAIAVWGTSTLHSPSADESCDPTRKSGCSQATGLGTLTPSKPSYAPGEPVSVTWTSGESTTAHASACPIGIRSRDGSIRYPRWCTLGPGKSLEPEKSFSLTWNQRDEFDRQVPEGMYQAIVGYYLANPGERRQLRTEFSITKASSSEPARTQPTAVGNQASTAPTATVTVIQPSAQASESVLITATNPGTEPITLPNGAPWVVKQGETTVFAPLATQALVTLGAGESRSWSWDQRDAQHQPVPSGSYTVELAYQAAGVVRTSQSSAITVTGSSPSTTSQPTLFAPNRTSGAAPLQVSLSCTATDAGYEVDFGDGVVAQQVSCPVMLTHSYSNVGSYTLVVQQNGVERSKQTITVSGTAAGANGSNRDGKGTPTKLGQTGTSLGLTLAVATAISVLVSLIVFRTPHDGNQEL